MGKKGNVDTCPHCSSKMKKGVSPFIYHGSFIGNFEAYVCHVCHHVYFTEKTYRDIMNLPLNPEESTDFSEEVMMPTVTSFNAVVIADRKKFSTNGIFPEKKPLDAMIMPVGFRGKIREQDTEVISES